MKSYEVRKSFLDHFESYDHQLYKSSSLVPHEDPTLLFTNAGMNQFKSVFTGEFPPPRSNKAVSSQKCVRAGGKHNDLDNVGFTARHHTFFEMLGNFSFGDYFKVGAIEMAWELLTKKYNLDPKRLYVTVYNDDDEAADIWKKHIGVPSDKIYRFGQKDNFWRMGDTGPCGPCSEIFYDQGENVGGDPKINIMGGDGDRFIEIWNLVFMQYFEDESGKLNPLPKPSIDTGMGLERISSILQGQTNNYNSDLFLPLIDVASRISKTNYSLNMRTDDKKAAALRVIADHSRAITFLLADGVIPSNEGRGYVLRRILRRAVRYSRTLTESSVLPEVCKQVIISMNDFYPELNSSKEFILKTVNDEQERFLETLDKGTEYLVQEISKTKKQNQSTLSSDFVFKLYDTYGFPSDLTQLMAQEQGLKIDADGFNALLETAKEKSKSAKTSKTFAVNNAEIQKLVHDLKSTEFIGYNQLSSKNSHILGIINSSSISTGELKAGETGLVHFDKTPFYAEGGGQTADIGDGSTTSGDTIFEISNVQKINNVFIHTITVKKGTLKTKDVVRLDVHENHRKLTASNHSATHLLHNALRRVLGTHVKQSGSLVTSEKLRFDFTNKGPLTEQQISEIEEIVNTNIQNNINVVSSEKSYTQAVEDGALALFGEKYEDKVRVIDMSGGIENGSIELCGGTHVTNLNQIKYFKIISESGVSSGIRRIEAVTDINAIFFLNKEFENFKVVKENLQLPKNADKDQVLAQIHKLKNEIQDLKKKNKDAALTSFSIDSVLASKTHKISGVKCVITTSDISEISLLRETTDKIKDKLTSGAIVITGASSDKTPVLVVVTKDLSQNLQAGLILKSLNEVFGGSGGGRPELAQGSLQNAKDFEAKALAIVKQKIESLL